MGNHELDGIGKRAWIDALYPGAVNPASWTVQPPLAPGNADRAYWSFDIGPHSHFIMLDGDYMFSDGLNTYGRQALGRTQLTWLANDIKANTTRNLFVFVHEPIDQQPTGDTPAYMLNDRAGLLELFAQHPKQVFVFSGHLHSLLGTTKWRGVTSVHVQGGTFGTRVTVNLDRVTLSDAGIVTNFDLHPMNQVQTVGAEHVVRVAEDGATAGNSREARMTVVGPENGVTPTFGSLMLKSEAMTWYAPRFISEQLVKITPGMKFSFDMFLADVVNGMDAVTVQPHWYMLNGSIPPVVIDQNGIALSRRPRDGSFFTYNEDVPSLGGRATGRWYRRVFDLSALAGNYIDGLYLTSAATKVNVGKIYVDNIKFTWPASPNLPPSVTLTSPLNNQRFTVPANVAVSATATDADGTISRVDFYAGSTLIGTSTTAPYSFTWSGASPGSYTLSAIATDNVGVSANSAPVTIAVDGATSVTSATFMGLDSMTQGAWAGVYGTKGYVLAQEGTSLPVGTTVVPGGHANWTWAGSTSDPRALRKTTGADRIAATWYSGSSFTIAVNPGDGTAHRMALYLLDWDNLARGQRIDVVDAATGAVLDTRTATGFTGGQYWVWTVTGAVQFRLTRTAGANAVVSAVFIDPVAGTAVAPASTPVTFVRTDATRQGSWRGTYGTLGYKLAQEGTSLPGGVTVTPSGHASWTWVGSTSDPRALQKSAVSDRLAATWYGSTFAIDVGLGAGQAYNVALYMVDWDTTARGQSIDVLDASTGAVLDRRTVASFNGGQYWVWTVRTSVRLRVTRTSGPNAVVSAVFLDPPN
jgi:hypothetical protein